jgi:hypothetical protein
MTAQQAADALACQSVLYAFAERIDTGRASQAVELFTDDARFAAGPRVAEGRAQLAAAFAAREANSARRTRHLMLNPICVPDGEAAMEVRSTLALFVLEPEAKPLAPSALLACTDRLLRGADGRWRIASRRLELVAGAP